MGGVKQQQTMSRNVDDDGLHALIEVWNKIESQKFQCAIEVNHNEDIGIAPN